MGLAVFDHRCSKKHGFVLAMLVRKEVFVCLFICCSLYCLNNPIQRNVFSCAGLPLAQFVCYEVFSKFTVQPFMSAAFGVTKAIFYSA